ncbi:MAG: S8 family serine peptidase, partial [Microcystaceae cyanobacterium]
MKKLLLFLLFLTGLYFALSWFVQTQGLAHRGQYASVIVNFKNDLPTSILTEQMQSIKASTKKNSDFNSVFSVTDHLYTVPGKKDELSLLRGKINYDYIDYIEPNYVYQALEVPNDPDYSKQWNFRSIGVEKAWDHSKGEGVIVAVIDTGVSRVPDLRETEFVEGYNFVEDNNDTSDHNGHGTHVAGTIAQSTNNKYGVAGIAYQAKIMPLKVLGDNGGGTVADIAEAIEYAANHGASVINLSLGGGGESKTLR